MLPKLQYPMIELTVPSLMKKVNFRQILVREEKILLMAKQSGDPADIMLAVKQIVNNCCQDSIDINQLAIFDLEWLFLRLSAQSFTNMVTVSYQDNEDEKIYNFDINLDDVAVPTIEGINNNILIRDGLGMLFKFPTVALLEDPKLRDRTKTYEEILEFIVPRCVSKVYGKDSDSYIFTQAELQQFIDDLDIKTMESIREFFKKIPSMKYEIKYTNEKGNERKIVLSTLNDFFTWF